MLRELTVEGLGAIDRAEISLGTGCSALTGETGAGKTLLVAALGLITGARADRTLVREGASGARVEARWVVPSDHPAAVYLAAQDMAELDGDDIEIVITRTVAADGSSTKARVNGRLATAALLTEVGRSLVEIAGQNEHQRLTTAGSQRTLLDSFAGPDTVNLAGTVASAVQDLAQMNRDLEELVSSQRERERLTDSLRHEVEEIEGAAVTEGETEHLKAEAARLEHAAAISGSLGSIRRSLRGEHGAIERVHEAAGHAREAAELDHEVTALADRLETLAIELEDVAQETGARDVAPDAARLEEARDRLGVLGKLRRKYGDTDGDVLEYLEQAKARLDELEATEDRVEEVRSRLESLSNTAIELASSLSSARVEAAARLEAEVETLLHELALPNARFQVELESVELYEGGNERVEFRLAANPGETPRPIAKVASGGELSRVALALHVLTGSGSVPTLVFDEVDAGVGGAAAQSVGRALARLADERGVQVLVVTHLPQVAAFASDQYRVVKASSEGRASVAVEKVQGSERVEELSRMLAGLPESERARSHAEELLEIAAARARS